jgi:hypothetical protein
VHGTPAGGNLSASRGSDFLEDDVRKTATLGLITLGIAAIFGCSGGGSAVDATPGTIDEAMALAESRGTPLVLDFYTDW